MARRGDRDEALRTYEAFDQILPNHPIVAAALADIKAGKPLDPLVKDARKAPPKCFMALAPPAASKAMNSPP